MTFKKIVVAGSSGTLADHVLSALLNSHKPKFDVTVLTRSNSDKKVSVPGARVVPVNYAEKEELVKAVTGADAIINLVSSKVGSVVDGQLLEAAKEARVRRLFPSGCGMDMLHPGAVALFTRPDGSPLAPGLAPVQESRNFVALGESNSTVSYTTLVPSLFIDAALEGRFGTIAPQKREVDLFDGGEHYFTGTSLPFLAQSFVAVLQMDEAKTRNKRIRVAEVRTTLKQIAETFEKVTGSRFEKVHVSLEETLQKREKALEEGQIFPAFFISLVTALFNGSGAADIKDGLQFDGDGFLNVKRKSLEELVTEAAKKVGIA